VDPCHKQDSLHANHLSSFHSELPFRASIQSWTCIFDTRSPLVLNLNRLNIPRNFPVVGFIRAAKGKLDVKLPIVE
jgi:hypothetical protein